MAYVDPAEVRAYLGTQADAGKWDDTVVEPSIEAAINHLQSVTYRQFRREVGTRLFSSNGRASLVIPDLQSATSVKQDGVDLTENTDYWLLPARTNRDIFTGLQLRRYGTNGAWRTKGGEWFDRGYDLAGGDSYAKPPNDVELEGVWGYDEPTDTPAGDEVFLPADALFAIKVLAAWFVLRPDSLLGNVSVTAEGAIRSYENLPIEVRSFIDAWRAGEQAALV